MKLILKKKAITNQNFSVYKKKSTQDDVFVHKLLRKLVPSVCLLVGHRARAAQQYHAKEVGFYGEKNWYKSFGKFDTNR